MDRVQCSGKSGPLETQNNTGFNLNSCFLVAHGLGLGMESLGASVSISVKLAY